MAHIPVIFFPDQCRQSKLTVYDGNIVDKGGPQEKMEAKVQSLVGLFVKCTGSYEAIFSSVHDCCFASGAVWGSG